MAVVGRGPEETEHVLAGEGVERTRGLVGEDDRRLGHEGTGHGDALLLAAGELSGPVRRPFGEPDAIEGRVGELEGVVAAVEEQREGDVLARAQQREEVEELEDEPDASAAHVRQRLFVQIRRAPRPSMATAPASGRSRPPTRCSRVDLPEPDGPMIATNSPAAIDRSTSRSAWTASCPLP